MPAPKSGTLSQTLYGTQPSVQTIWDVCLKCTCSLNTSAFSTLEVLDDNRALEIYLLTYLQWCRLKYTKHLLTNPILSRLVGWIAIRHAQSTTDFNQRLVQWGHYDNSWSRATSANSSIGKWIICPTFTVNEPGASRFKRDLWPKSLQQQCKPGWCPETYKETQKKRNDLIRIWTNVNLT